MTDIKFETLTPDQAKDFLLSLPPEDRLQYAFGSGAGRVPLNPTDGGNGAGNPLLRQKAAENKLNIILLLSKHPEGLTYAAIARGLNVNFSTARSAVTRLRERNMVKKKSGREGHQTHWQLQTGDKL
jgi:hypothetical protein